MRRSQGACGVMRTVVREGARWLCPSFVLVLANGSVLRYDAAPPLQARGPRSPQVGFKVQP
jgi:hypothetical protein